MGNELVVYETRGLKFRRKPETIAEMGSIMQGLQYFSDNLPWAMGDALNFGQDRFGEEFSQFIPERSAKTYMNYCWVSRRIPYDERTFDLSYTHYAEAAGLVREARMAVLAKALEGEWTVARLRQEIKGLPQHKTRLLTCPACSAELEYKAGTISLKEVFSGQSGSDNEIRESVSG